MPGEDKCTPNTGKHLEVWVDEDGPRSEYRRQMPRAYLSRRFLPFFFLFLLNALFSSFRWRPLAGKLDAVFIDFFHHRDYSHKHRDNLLFEGIWFLHDPLTTNPELTETHPETWDITSHSEIGRLTLIPATASLITDESSINLFKLSSALLYQASILYWRLELTSLRRCFPPTCMSQYDSQRTNLLGITYVSWTIDSW